MRSATLTIGAALVASGATALALSDLAADQLGDPGLPVRVMIPLISAVGDVATAVTMAALVLAAVVIPARSPAFALSMRIALVASVVWTLTAIAAIVGAYAVAAGTPLDAPEFGGGVQLFVTSFELGQYLLAAALLAAVTATVTSAATGPVGAGWSALAALVALVPIALSGHSGSAENHETATTSLGLHLIGLSVWVGGVIVLALVARHLGSDMTGVATRFSGLALVAACLVVGSGVLNASTRIDTVDQLGSQYGLLVVAKLGLGIVLVAVGAVHRRSTLPAVAAGQPHAFTRLLVAEVVIMAATIGVAVALSTTVPPVSEVTAPLGATAVEVLAGYPEPPAPTAERYLVSWQPDPLWLLVAGALLVGYLCGVRRLRRRGDAWPPLRTLLFTVGCIALVWVTSGGPAVYGRWTFSGHMAQHMLLAMIVPIFFVAGAPLLLAMRTLRPRTDGSRGAREWLLGALQSPLSHLATNPIVAAMLFSAGMVAFYYSPLFSLALRTHLGHELMTTHFLLTGYLFVWVLIGVDPGPRRVAHPFRLLVLLATMAFHAFFGVALLQGQRILAADYWVPIAAGRGWGTDALSDQQVGAAFAWGFGEAPTLVIALAVAVAWVRDDSRESRRKDRQADRDGDAELASYNSMLAGLAERDVSGAAESIRR